MQKFCSIFSQLLQLFPRLEFEEAVRKHRADYALKGFPCWGQFVAMLFASSVALTRCARSAVDWQVARAS